MTVFALLATSSPVIIPAADSHAENLDFTVRIAPVLNVNIPTNLVKLNFSPTSSDPIFQSENLAINVTTNYKSGYELQLSASTTDLTRSGAITPADGPTYTPTIPTLAAGEYTESTFTTNHWGIKVNTDASTALTENAYIPFATTNKVSYSTGPVADSNTTVTLAAKTDTDQAAGLYELVLKFTAVPRITGTVGIDDLYYMQDFRYLSATDRTNVLNSMTTNEQYRLIDQRDNNAYFISKLADGKVWMTQNLDHAISSNVTYNHDTTDLGYGDSTVQTWTPSTTATSPATISDAGWVPGTSTGVVTDWSTDGNTARWAEGGTHYIYTDGSNSGATEIYDSESECVAAGHAISECDHYRVGNFYNWAAAVALNSASGITGNKDVAKESICPAGWRLPLGPTGSAGSEFNTLLSLAGVANGTDSGSGDIINVGYQTNGWNKLSTHPLYFTRAGGLWSADYSRTTTVLLYWSATSYNGSLAYHLSALSGGLYPADRSHRGYGFSVRCVAR